MRTYPSGFMVGAAALRCVHFPFTNVEGALDRYAPTSSMQSVCVAVVQYGMSMRFPSLAGS